ncbi:MAG TPA: folylpolyglutamate synthase/dihydrofolate synthase family protein [Limnochordales bacterium]
MHPAEQELWAYLDDLSRFGMRLGLERMRALMARLGDPHRGFACVHVAGTNGKGSTCAMLAAMARAAGLRVGLYTSPHLVHFHERIVVDGRPIDSHELVEAYRAVRQAVERLDLPEPPTHFEFVTAMAFWHMARVGVQLAVVEVGLGGRLDATNVVQPELCVLTPIGLDHTQVLGPRLQDVAREKAGIVKPGVPVVAAPQPPEAMEVIEAACRAAASPLVTVRPAEPGHDGRLEGGGGHSPSGPAVYRYGALSTGLEGSWLWVEGPEGFRAARLRVALLGSHQVQNAAVAVAAAHQLAGQGWPFTVQAMAQGLAQVQWPGRLQVLARDPWVLLDGAHNPPAAQALAAAVKELFGRPAPVLVVGMLQEKDRAGTLAPLVAAGPQLVVATRSRSARTAPAHPAQLAELAVRLGTRRAVAVAPASHAVEVAVQAVRRTGGRGPVLVTGSLYLAGEVLASWRPAGIDMVRR